MATKKSPLRAPKMTSDKKDVGISVKRYSSHAAVKGLAGDSRVAHPGQPMSLPGSKSGKVAPSTGQSARNNA